MFLDCPVRPLLMMSTCFSVLTWPLAWQLIIGEDTNRHIANLIWIFDLKSSTNADPSKNLTRIASTPMGSETTSPYWYTIGNWSYMTFVVQHPYEVNTFHGDDDAQWASITATNAEGKLCTCRLPEGHSSLNSCELYICHEPQLCNCRLS